VTKNNMRHMYGVTNICCYCCHHEYMPAKPTRLRVEVEPA